MMLYPFVKITEENFKKFKFKSDSLSWKGNAEFESEKV